GGLCAERLRARLSVAYYRYSSSSPTSALIRAIQQVNAQVYVENERAADADRISASVACVVVGEADAYFAFVGDTVGFALGPWSQDRLGRGPKAPRERSPRVIGHAEDVDVALFHRALLGQSTIVVATA